ncbi:hypothetical protein Ddc_03824 [Ditylenchus destructor]|nr:hypothetical protein Ddc_03824 [Ditylenchus destructor]
MRYNRLSQITSQIEFSSGAESRVKPESNTSKSLNLIEIQNYVSGSSIAVAGEEEKMRQHLLLTHLFVYVHTLVLLLLQDSSLPQPETTTTCPFFASRLFAFSKLFGGG